MTELTPRGGHPGQRRRNWTKAEDAQLLASTNLRQTATQLDRPYSGAWTRRYYLTHGTWPAYNSNDNTVRDQRNEATRAVAANHCQPWRPDEDEQLLALATDPEATLESLALTMGRSLRGVSDRLNKLLSGEPIDYDRAKAGGGRPAHDPKPYGVCGSCFLALPASGHCDDCED